MAKHEKHIGEIVLNLECGNALYLITLAKKFKTKEVMDKIIEDGQYIHKNAKNKYHIPASTANLMATNTRGVILSTTLCPHCKQNIVMTLSNIINQDTTWCCNCLKNLYNSKDKKVQKVRW